MTRYDVFNGDADGLCALQQLRLADPAEALLVTGPKRDIALLDRVHAGDGDVVTVLDVSMAANRASVLRLLDAGARIVFFDHHRCDDVPSHPRLEAHVDTSAAMCTSLIVDRHLRGAHGRWAVVGAYGDGLHEEADRRAAGLGVRAAERRALRSLGIDLNYNAYGDSEADLIAPPLHVHALLRGVADPLAVADDGTLARIHDTRLADLERALACPVAPAGEHAQVCVLPDAAWSRRIRGTLAHELSRRSPERGCAVLSPDARGGYVVSVRAPLAARTGADGLCAAFGGDGRAGAAGIGHLPADRLDAFVATLARSFAH
ncbi:MAG TPA: acetyltransferase [Casimicrobiaceae bacterium]|nr:acetyltransferase [Casimicrobiaceae bacterium]